MGRNKMNNFSDLGISQAVETFQNRVGSPLFGSVALSFISVNWKALFYLFFDKDKEVWQRIFKFDQLTSWETLGLYPILIGAALALGLPWINWGVRWAIQYPVAQSRMLNERVAAQRAAEKTRLLEHKSGRIISPEDITQKLGQVVLGVIPKVNPESEIIAESLQDTLSRIYEAYASAVTDILLNHPESKIIHLASLRSGEGKSTTALALAVILSKSANRAKSANRVLLIEADMRRPTFHLSAAGECIGLSGWLTQKMDVSNAIRRVSHGFDVIPAGVAVPNSADLLSTPKFHELLEIMSKNMTLSLSMDLRF